MSSFTPINPPQRPSGYLSFDQMLNPAQEQTKSTTTSAMAQPSAKNYMCSVEGCGKNYKDASGLRKHRQSIHENITYSCREIGCGKNFNRLENLNRHIKTNHVGARYYCPIEDCGKDYSDPSSLNRHVSKSH